MPFFKLKEMPEPVVAPGYSTAYGPTITGARPHHHPGEQIILVLAGRLRMGIGRQTRDIGPGEAALIPGN
jgi:mannose-6-phosphate isomerase-like protein (cupin superfamily)